jgi:hypothetical protein
MGAGCTTGIRPSPSTGVSPTPDADSLPQGTLHVEIPHAGATGTRSGAGDDVLTGAWLLSPGARRGQMLRGIDDKGLYELCAEMSHLLGRAQARRGRMTFVLRGREGSDD